MYALVRWIGGEDDKNYTPGIPIDWIKGFNVNDLKSKGFDESASYVVEWHTSKKPPGGWLVYDAYVIEVSSTFESQKIFLYTLFVVHWNYNNLLRQRKDKALKGKSATVVMVFKPLHCLFYSIVACFTKA